MLEEYGQSMLDDFQTWDQEIKKAPKLNIDGLLRVHNEGANGKEADPGRREF